MRPEDLGDDVDDELPVVGPVYESVHEWVTGWLAHMVRRRLGGGGTAWCARWSEHDEAVARLGALWAAWETTNVEGGTAPSAWWVHHFDPHWAVLTASNGAFASCGPDRHNPDPPPLPTTNEEDLDDRPEPAG